MGAKDSVRESLPTSDNFQEHSLGCYRLRHRLTICNAYSDKLILSNGCNIRSYHDFLNQFFCSLVIFGLTGVFATCVVAAVNFNWNFEILESILYQNRAQQEQLRPLIAQSRMEINTQLSNSEKETWNTDKYRTQFEVNMRLQICKWSVKDVHSSKKIGIFVGKKRWMKATLIDIFYREHDQWSSDTPLLNFIIHVCLLLLYRYTIISFIARLRETFENKHF